MVRVVSQNFSPPRSRHSSGETDWDLAERTDAALSALGKKRFELGFSEYESSSDSFWDSEIDFEHPDDANSKGEFVNDDINGNGSSSKSDVHSKRKERRRERNKLSAQAYRKRKRQITYNKQQELFILEKNNKDLLELVNRLEKKTEKAKMYLRGIPIPAADIPLSGKVKEETGIAKGIPVHHSPPSTNTPEEYAGKSSQSLNLNLNKNLHLQPSLGGKSAAYEVNAEGAMARKASDPTDLPILPNTNISPLTPILINANTLVGANNVDKNSFPSHLAFRSLVPVKSKHAYFNSNLNFKSPILRPSTLQTVPEIPSSQGEVDDNSMPTTPTTPDKSSLISQGDATLEPFKEKKVPCDSMKMALSNANANMNLNKRNFEYANDNYCDNHVQVNSFLMNINGNFNQNAVASKKQEVYH